MGVQDFDPRVQAAIGRIQPPEATVDLFQSLRNAGFESVNFDLVYGLPYQTRESFGKTVRQVVQLEPDRIATFGYAHPPDLRPNQRAVDASGLPDQSTRLEIFFDTIEELTGNGYSWIGLEHFALDHDELMVAAREGRLRRNFMGYTTRQSSGLIAFGSSAIGNLAGRFIQRDASSKTSRAWAAINQRSGRPPFPWCDAT